MLEGREPAVGEADFQFAQFGGGGRDSPLLFDVFGGEQAHLNCHVGVGNAVGDSGPDEIGRVHPSFSLVLCGGGHVSRLAHIALPFWLGLVGWFTTKRRC
jgi:hypothetical protein